MEGISKPRSTNEILVESATTDAQGLVNQFGKEKLSLEEVLKQLAFYEQLSSDMHIIGYHYGEIYYNVLVEKMREILFPKENPIPDQLSA